MSFELTIATRRTPPDLGSDDVRRAPSSYTTIEVTGVCNREDVRALLSTISTTLADGADTVLLDAHDVSSDDPECFPIFTRGLMAIRASGGDVQMRVRDPEQHARLAALPNSRDWLLAGDTAGTGGRRALHLDGVLDPNESRAPNAPVRDR